MFMTLGMLITMNHIQSSLLFLKYKTSIMKNLYQKFIKGTSALKDFPLLFLRLILAYGFYKPAIMKVKDFNAIAGWFESMNYPFPKVNAYLAGITEFAGVFLLVGFRNQNNLY